MHAQRAESPQPVHRKHQTPPSPGNRFATSVAASCRDQLLCTAERSRGNMQTCAEHQAGYIAYFQSAAMPTPAAWRTRFMQHPRVLSVHDTITWRSPHRPLLRTGLSSLRSAARPRAFLPPRLTPELRDRMSSSSMSDFLNTCASQTATEDHAASRQLLSQNPAPTSLSTKRRKSRCNRSEQADRVKYISLMLASWRYT